MLTKHMAACLVVTALGAAPALAQTSTMPSASPPASGSYLTQLGQNHYLASKLIGTKVVGSSNESIGDVNDVIVERDGRPIAAIIGVGGFLGIGEKYVAVPFSALQFATREQANAMAANPPATGSTATAPSTTPAPSARLGAGPELIILRMTKVDLQNAPSFNPERSPAPGTTAPKQ
ncbi:PRC-barrel domain-containing protein [Microvirga terricola]|uniref:PRC-barrel domain containing protein n=1 Tax=Microvirga terricola TaxID=2719797 RepID=A0ABX0VAE0_9HYPH|nr:PRC-barrel domain-containing protein [Microvirga terricola]NIX76808.1 PRC-barrel domain containing protein [Microvirga terricola]